MGEGGRVPANYTAPPTTFIVPADMQALLPFSSSAENEGWWLKKVFPILSTATLAKE